MNNIDKAYDKFIKAKGAVVVSPRDAFEAGYNKCADLAYIIVKTDVLNPNVDLYKWKYEAEE